MIKKLTLILLLGVVGLVFWVTGRTNDYQEFTAVPVSPFSDPPSVILKGTHHERRVMGHGETVYASPYEVFVTFKSPAFDDLTSQTVSILLNPGTPAATAISPLRVQRVVTNGHSELLVVFPKIALDAKHDQADVIAATRGTKLTWRFLLKRTSRSWISNDIFDLLSKG
jgi:hypothetical protein